MTALNNPNVVHHLTRDDKEITLLGTAHVSKESVALVKTVIEQENPDTVAVELCPSRFETIKQKDQWREMDIIKVIREKKRFCCWPISCWPLFRKESRPSWTSNRVPR